MLHYCCDGLTDHFKNPFFSFTSYYASAVLVPPDGLEVFGASAGESAGLDADADLLGASELDVEELAPSAKGAMATAARRIKTSTRARAMAESLGVKASAVVNCGACVSVLVTAFCVLGMAILVALYVRLVPIFGWRVGVALRWHVSGFCTWLVAVLADPAAFRINRCILTCGDLFPPCLWFAVLILPDCQSRSVASTA